MRIEVNSERWFNPKRIGHTELWRKVEILPNEYSVSSFGRVKKKKQGEYIILRQFKKEKGYWRIKIGNKWFPVHRLVCMAFVKNPYNKPMVDHINGDPGDNRVSNIRWATNSENMMNPIAVEKRRIARRSI